MSIQLWVFPASPRAFKVLFAAHQFGVDYELKFINLFKGEQNAPEYRAINPHGRMPTLADGDYVLWESNAIVNYLASKAGDTTAFPQDAKERLGIEKWQFWEANHWDPMCAIFVFERFVKGAIGRGAADPAEIARGTQLFERNAPALDAQLQKTRYVAGDHLTTADISLGAAFAASEIAQFPVEPYRGIQRWQADLASMPGWQKAASLAKQYSPS